jgi:hypothetical protein
VYRFNFGSDWSSIISDSLYEDSFFDEGPSHYSLKAFCETPMKMMRMNSFLPFFTINGAPVE